ncbi:DUF2867 domain-containing protein [Sandarakinorhabdus glacialis]|uniref:DUF2867 domain-containing protein n=1 Tax=Sandarakinorhabdus glacialis TaxID=1614636 RepID=UPI001663BCAF|nr:DUF2867 domain-containing protein [Polymorphobacter glacialis]
MISSSSPQAIVPPSGSALAPGYAGADLVDAYAIALPADATRDIEALARAILTHPPAWVGTLMLLRDAIMGRLGIKTAGQLRTRGDRRDRIDFFPVVSRSDREILVGEDDRHLDFRASVLVFADGGQDIVSMTTVVHCHNRLGRFYLMVIGPFHVVIVRTFIRNAARRGWPKV